MAQVGAEEVEAAKVNVADVVLSAEQVRAHEVSGRSVAEPIAGLGLHEPVFPFVAVDVPSVEIAGEVHRPAGSHAHLCSEIYRSSCIIEQVGLDSELLGLRRRGHKNGSCGKNKADR